MPSATSTAAPMPSSRNGRSLGRAVFRSTPTTTTTKIDASATASSRRSATIVPISVRLLASVRRFKQHHAQHLAGARRQHVVAHVADRGEAVGVAALGVDAGVVEDPVPALAAHQRGDRVEGRAGQEPGDGLGPAREHGSVLARCPPDHRPEGDHEEQDLDEREASVHGWAPLPGRAPWACRTGGASPSSVPARARGRMGRGSAGRSHGSRRSDDLAQQNPVLCCALPDGAR